MLKDNKIIILAYISALLGVCGHASSEFFVKLSGKIIVNLIRRICGKKIVYCKKFEV